eukprot:3482641-Lingulodinium_polyedra.AAC.1
MAVLRGCVAIGRTRKKHGILATNLDNCVWRKETGLLLAGTRKTRPGNETLERELGRLGA